MKILILIFTALSFCYAANAQTAAEICSKKQRNHTIHARTTTATIEEDDYDVTHVAFDIALTNLSTEISGNVITTARVVAPSMSIYAFELTDDLAVDSVKINNVLIAQTAILSVGSVTKVTLNTPLTLNTIFTAQVYYHGQPPTSTMFFSRGLNQSTLVSGTAITYTNSEPYASLDWWPCKQSLQDKIDSVDMWVTVPSGIKAGSNGLLNNITSLSGGRDRYEWKTKYAIDYYLVSVAVAPYSDYSYYMHFTDGSGDSMLIQNYVYDSAAFVPLNKAVLDSTGLIVDYFSKLFGRYPFDKEKYGHCFVDPFMSGGMENQTMSTVGIGFLDNTLIAHELGHQWWGDDVTCSSWTDIWLNEGFASYAEQLFVEHFSGAGPGKFYRIRVFDNAMLSPDGSVYVNDTVNVNRIFDYILTYNKGASVVHMLRYMAPKDEDFFTVLQNYRQQHAFGSASTSDLKAIAEQVYGRPLDTFFNQWIYKEGYPSYSGRWYQDGGQFYLQINQSVSAPASISYFTMPVKLLLRSMRGDTVIVVNNNAVSQNYTLPVGRKIFDVVLDPDVDILGQKSQITEDPTLSVTDEQINSVSVYPNPSTNGWYITGLPSGTQICLSDISGVVKYQSQSNASITFIPSHNLLSGNYQCMVSKGGVTLKVIKLTK